jgi:hypothetical protein
MAKIKLGAKPEAFKPVPVKFTMPDGSEGLIMATFRYRTRAEFGQLMNDLGPTSTPTKPDGSLNFVALYQSITEKNAKHLLDSLAAWDLEDALTMDNVSALANEVPAACAALASAYSAACQEGRLGN